MSLDFVQNRAGIWFVKLLVPNPGSLGGDPGFCHLGGEFSNYPDDTQCCCRRTAIFSKA